MYVKTDKYFLISLVQTSSHTCLPVLIYLCVYLFLDLLLYIYIYIYIYTCVYIYMYELSALCVYVCAYIYIYVHTYTLGACIRYVTSFLDLTTSMKRGSRHFVYIYIYIHMYIYIYIYIYIHIYIYPYAKCGPRSQQNICVRQRRRELQSLALRRHVHGCAQPLHGEQPHAKTVWDSYVPCSSGEAKENEVSARSA